VSVEMNSIGTVRNPVFLSLCGSTETSNRDFIHREN